MISAKKFQFEKSKIDDSSTIKTISEVQSEICKTLRLWKIGSENDQKGRWKHLLANLNVWNGLKKGENFKPRPFFCKKENFNILQVGMIWKSFIIKHFWTSLYEHIKISLKYGSFAKCVFIYKCEEIKLYPKFSVFQTEKAVPWPFLCSQFFGKEKWSKMYVGDAKSCVMGHWSQSR